MRMNFVIIEETKKFMCNIYRFELELNSTRYYSIYQEYQQVFGWRFNSKVVPSRTKQYKQK